MWWKDARLAYNGTADGGCVDKLVYNAADAKAQLWQPDFYFEFDATTPVVGAEGDGYLLEVYPDGSIWTADKFFRVAFMPCYGIFLAAKFSQIEAYAHADE